jgi:hypothetical protein
VFVEVGKNEVERKQPGGDSARTVGLAVARIRYAYGSVDVAGLDVVELDSTPERFCFNALLLRLEQKSPGCALSNKLVELPLEKEAGVDRSNVKELGFA